MGKRLHADFFLEDGRARGRGLQLPPRARDGDGPGARLRDRELGSRLRRLRARSPTSARCGGFPGSRGPRSCSATSRWHDGSPVVAVAAAGARRRRSSGAAARGLRARCSAPSSSSSSSRRATPRRTRSTTRDLTPSVPYILDYHVLATTYDEPFIRARSATACRRPGMPVESSKGEAWPGQHEINFRYADALDDGRQPHRLQERRQGARAPATAAR